MILDPILLSQHNSHQSRHSFSSLSQFSSCVGGSQWTPYAPSPVNVEDSQCQQVHQDIFPVTDNIQRSSTRYHADAMVMLPNLT